MKNFPNAFFGSASKPLPDWRGSEDFDPDDDDMDETPPDVISMLSFDPKEFDDDADEEWHPFIEFGLDEANFKESEHPRDADGKFSPYQHSISGEVGKKMKTNLKTLEFKKATKTSSGKFKYENPSGAVIVIEPPPEKGAWSAKWTWYPGPNTKEPIKGSGNKSLSDALEQYAKWNDLNKPESGTPKQEAPKQEEPKKTEEPPKSNTMKLLDTLLDKGFTKAQNYWEKGDGSKIKFVGEKWLSVLPGHVTKMGVGFADLEKLLNGEVPPSAKSVKTANIDYWPNPAPESKPAPQQPQPKQQTSSGQQHWSELQLELTSDAPKPTPTQLSAIRSYTGSTYREMNSNLRENYGQILPGSNISHLQEYLMSAETPKDITVFRKVGDNFAKFLKSIAHPGGTWHDKGFTSCALNKEVWHGSIHMEIEIKKGFKGASINNMSSNKGETEFLLPAGSIFKFKKITPQANGVTHMKMELIDQSLDEVFKGE
jgi:hypothetical protein